MNTLLSVKPTSSEPRCLVLGRCVPWRSIERTFTLLFDAHVLTTRRSYNAETLQRFDYNYRPHLEVIIKWLAGFLIFFASTSNRLNAAEVVSIPYDPEAGKWLFNAQNIVSRNDPLYTAPSVEPWEAMPVGGGDLSAMVRCDGTLHLHLSKSDAWGFWSAFDLPNDESDPKAPWSYWFFNVVSPGHVSIDFGREGKAAAKGYYRQRLDLYRGKIIIQMGGDGNSVDVEVWGHPERKIIVVEVSDPNSILGETSIELLQWRKSMVVGNTVDRIHANEALKRPARPFLVNTGMADYFDDATDPLLNRGTAVVVAAPSRKAVNCSSDNTPVRIDNSIARVYKTKDALGELPLKAAAMHLPKIGAKYYYIIVAAAVDPKGDALAKANKELDEAAKVPLEVLKAEHAEWWSDWWSKSTLRIQSPDKAADWLCAAYHVHLYTLGCVNRGPYPAKWDGGAGLMRGDERRWGGAEHIQETRFTYMPLLGANRLEMAKSYTGFYTQMIRYIKVQTERMWGLPGLWFPETLFPWGHTMDFQLKETDPNYSVPGHFLRWHPDAALYGKFNWFNPYTGLHFNPGLEVSHNYLDYYTYTCDEDFLRDEAYPIVRGVCEFFTALLRKEWDGRYHLDPASALESWWLVRDPADAMDGIRAIFPKFIEVSEKFDRDPGIRAKCREILAALPEPPRARWTMDNKIDYTADVYAPAAARGPFDRRNAESPELYRVYPHGVSGIGSKDYELAKRTFETRPVDMLPAGWSQDGIWAARLGLADEAARILKEQARKWNTFPYGGWRSGDDITYTNNLSANPFLDAGGNSAFSLQEMLLQSHDNIIRILPAWPKDWSGLFRLRARGGFLVTAGFQGAMVPFVELKSLFGKECVIENPWPGHNAIVRKADEIVLESDKQILRFPTAKDTTYVIEPSDRSLVPYQSRGVDDRPNNSPGLPGRD